MFYYKTLSLQKTIMPKQKHNLQGTMNMAEYNAYILPKKTNKSDKKKDWFYNGHQYDSPLEVEYAKKLDLLKRAGEIKDWYPHPKTYQIVLNNIEICKYTPDFVKILNTGEEVIIDTKGYKGGKGYNIFMLKRKLVKAQFGVTIEIVTAAMVKGKVKPKKKLVEKYGRSRSIRRNKKRKA